MEVGHSSMKVFIDEFGKRLVLAVRNDFKELQKRLGTREYMQFV